MRKQYLVSVLPLLSLIWFTVTLIWGGYSYESYDHSSQFISELGATGTAYGNVINYLGFIPTELFILGFVFYSYNILPNTVKNRIGLILIAVYAVMLIVAAIFPCDFECRPETPSFKHVIHLSSAVPAYLSAIGAIIVISLNSNEWSGSNTVKVSGLIFGSVALIAFLNMDENSQWVGLVQRTLEFSIYSWLVILGFNLKKCN